MGRFQGGGGGRGGGGSIGSLGITEFLLDILLTLLSLSGPSEGLLMAYSLSLWSLPCVFLHLLRASSVLWLLFQ